MLYEKLKIIYNLKKEGELDCKKMNKLTRLNSFYKGPITSCEYVSNDKLLIGYGPYLSLVNDESFDELSKLLALKYRVIHKIVRNMNDSTHMCVFGQKAFNIIKFDDKNNQLETINLNCIELDDWIFDIFYMNKDYLVIVCAHNQCILFNLNDKLIEKKVECNQKCMLYIFKL